MTARDLLETGLRLLGVYFVVIAVVQMVFAGAGLSPMVSFQGAGASTILIVWLPPVVLCLVGNALWFFAEHLAKSVGSRGGSVAGSMNPGEVLRLGVFFIGVWMVARGLGQAITIGIHVSEAEEAVVRNLFQVGAEAGFADLFVGLALIASVFPFRKALGWLWDTRHSQDEREG